MHHPTAIVAAFAALLATIPSVQAGMYTKSSPVLQVGSRDFDKLITKSNYTSIVEFYAPWCGHCQNLKPIYEKVAKNLDGLAKVAAVDCDDDANKPLCGTYGIQGFPTLKTFRPGAKPGSKPIVDDYRGARTATAITEDVVGKINNHVTKVTDKDLESFLGKEGSKVILFTDKGATSALLRSVAIDFLDVINVAQIRNKEAESVTRFGIEKFPTLVLVPEGSDSEPIVYDGELKKADILAFLKQVAEPNPDPAPAKSKGGDSKQKKASNAEAEKSKPAEPRSSEDPSDTASKDAPSSTSIPISTISSSDMLQESCLLAKSNTCVLALVPPESSEKGDLAVESLSKLNTKYIHAKRTLFPLYSLPSTVDSASSLRSALELKGDVELVAINARRGWWRHYDGDFSLESVESWIDAIRMGDLAKNSLPKEIVSDKGEGTEAAAKSESAPKETEEAVEKEKEETAEETIAHEEL